MLCRLPSSPPAPVASAASTMDVLRSAMVNPVLEDVAHQVRYEGTPTPDCGWDLKSSQVSVTELALELGLEAVRRPLRPMPRESAGPPRSSATKNRRSGEGPSAAGKETMEAQVGGAPTMDSWTRLVHDPDWFPTPAQVSWRSIASKIARRGADHDQPSHSPNNTTSTTSAARLIAQHGELPDKHSRCAYGIA